MSKQPISLLEIKKIKSLRKTGHTLYEIKNIIKRSNGTISKYIKGVNISPLYKNYWKSKKGGSKARSDREWQNAKIKASEIIRSLNFGEKMLVLSCLYWGEGNKRELNVINSDPSMIRVIMSCLKDLGVPENEFKISLRLFEDIKKDKALDFWTKTLCLPKNFIQKIDVIRGRKIGKLEYGMCRLRVRKGGRYFKLIISMIDLIRLKIK